MTKIMVVDDEYDMLQAVKGALEDEGYEVAACSNGKQALELIPQAQPNLLLLDVMMPEMGGIEVMAALKRLPSFDGIPVVLMSAVELSKKEASKPVAFLKKPFNLDLLFETVSRYAGKPDRS